MVMNSMFLSDSYGRPVQYKKKKSLYEIKMSRTLNIVAETNLVFDDTKMSVKTMSKADLLFVGINMRDGFAQVKEMQVLIRRLNTMLPRGLGMDSLKERTDEKTLRPLIASAMRQWWKLLGEDRYRTGVFPRPTATPSVVSSNYTTDIDSGSTSGSTSGSNSGSMTALKEMQEEINDLESKLQVLSTCRETMYAEQDANNVIKSRKVRLAAKEQQLSDVLTEIEHVEQQVANC